VRYGRTRASPFCVGVNLVNVVGVVGVVGVVELSSCCLVEEKGRRSGKGTGKFARGWLIVRSLDQRIYTVELSC
jgi:hypothetical protein